jgi:hypothetical protein
MIIKEQKLEFSLANVFFAKPITNLIMLKDSTEGKKLIYVFQNSSSFRSEDQLKLSTANFDI